MSRLRSLLRVYSRLMKVHWVILLEYRGDTLFYMLGSFIYPLVTLAVWTAISAGGAVGGYDQRDFITYFLAVLFVGRLVASWDAWEIEQHLREGTLSNYLLRPSSYFHWRFSENIVYKLFYGTLMLIAWAVAWPFTDVVHISLDPIDLLTVLLAILLAALVRYMLFYAIALFGFWTTRMLALVTLFEALSQFFSGRIAPYSLLPDWVQTLQAYTPFYWILGFPVDLLTGKTHVPSLAYGFTVQLAWAVGLTALYLVLWKRGLKTYSAVGG